MSQQATAEGLQQEAVQALEEIRSTDTAEWREVISGKLSAEAYEGNRKEREEKITATEKFVAEAARLNTISDRVVDIGDRMNRPAALQPLSSQTDGDGDGESDSDKFDRRYHALSSEIESWISNRDNGVTADGGPVMAKGSKPRTLLNKMLRHDVRGQPFIRAAKHVELSSQDWDYLYKPRTEQLMNPWVDRDGGYIVAEEFRNEMIALRTLATGIKSRFRSIATNAAKVAYPTANVSFNFQNRDRTGQGAITTVRLTDVFGKTTFVPGGEDVILIVPEQLVEDATFDLVGFLAEEANRVSDEQDEFLGISGSGSGEPLGYLTALVKLYDKITAPSGQQIGIDDNQSGDLAWSGADFNEEFIQIFDTYVLPAAGRANAVWTGPVQFERRVRLFREKSGGDNTGEFLFKRALQAGAPNTLNGYPLLTSQFYPDHIDGTNSASTDTGDPLFHFGDLRDYWWVEKAGLRMRVLDQLYAGTSEIGYKWDKQQDGALVRADANVYARRQ